MNAYADFEQTRTAKLGCKESGGEMITLIPRSEDRSFFGFRLGFDAYVGVGKNLLDLYARRCFTRVHNVSRYATYDASVIQRSTCESRARLKISHLLPSSMCNRMN